MNNIPDKCLNCDQTVIQLENVHKGMNKYQMETVVRCKRSPMEYIVGCVSAEVYCMKRGMKDEKD